MEKLISILQIQTEKYKALKKSAEEQTELLTGPDHEAFRKKTHQLEGLINEIKLLEKGKQSLLEAGIAEPAADEKKIIDGLMLEIRKLAGAVKKINECNELLLKSRMEFIQFNINVLTSVTADVPYQAHGNMPDTGTNKIKMFDQSI